ncbi:unnamed protein product, partial [Heterosigma akashiwo]
IRPEPPSRARGQRGRGGGRRRPRQPRKDTVMENNITSGANSPNRPQNMDHVAITFRGVPQKNPILRPGCELVATRAASKGNVDRSRAAKRMKRANVRGHTPAIIVGRATGCLILIHVQSWQAIVKKADTPPPSISSD